MKKETFWEKIQRQILGKPKKTFLDSNDFLLEKEKMMILLLKQTSDNLKEERRQHFLRWNNIKPDERKCVVCLSSIAWATDVQKTCSRKCGGLMRSGGSSLRKERMLKLRQEGKSLQEIGKVFQLSRERVRQIGKGIEGFTRSVKTPMKMVEKPCLQCAKMFVSQFCLKKKYCSLLCLQIEKVRKLPTLEQKREKWNAHTKAYYHSVLKHRADFKKKNKIQNDRYREKKSLENPHFWRDYQRKIYQKRVSTPEGRDAYNKRMREYNLRKKFKI